MTAPPDLRQVLRDYATVAQSMVPAEHRELILEAWILRHANVFGQAIPKPRSVPRGTPKQCFKNATRLIIRRPDEFAYCEGFAMESRICFPFHHAWVVNPAGEIIDNTIRGPENHQYVGIKFDPADVFKAMGKFRVYGLLDPGFGLNVEYMKRWNNE